jgi:putative MATE family efflux protein
MLDSNLLIKRNFLRKLVFISLPMVLQSVLSNLLNFIDNIMVGGLGNVSIEAVSMINQIFFVYACVLCGTISGIGVFSTQFFGKKDYIGVKKSFQVKCIFALIIIVLAIIIFTFLKNYIINMYLHDCDMYDKQCISSEVNKYLPFITLSIIPFAIKKIYASTLNESGNTKLTMYSSVIAVISNTFLNYLLIYGKCGLPVLGVYGASIATFISRCIETFVVIFFSNKELYFLNDIYSKIFTSKSFFVKITKNIIPLIINTFFWSYSFSVVTQIYSIKTIDNIAIMSITTTFTYFFIDILVNMGCASEIVLGHELGKNNFNLAHILAKRILIINVFISFLFSFFMYFFSFYFPNFYNVSDDIKIMSSKCIQSFAFTFVITTFVNTTFHILRSGGKTLLTTLFDSCFIWCVMIPIQFLLVKFTSFELNIIYLYVLLIQLFQCIFGYIIIHKKIWIKNLI